MSASMPALALLATCLASGLALAQDHAAKSEPAPTVESMPPVVVETFPRAGRTDVEPGKIEIKVTFSKPMMDHSWSWATAWQGSDPKMTGQPKFIDDGRTCVLPVELEPGHTYGYWINSQRFADFKDADGRPAVPYLLVFATGEVEGLLSKSVLAKSQRAAIATAERNVARIKEVVDSFMLQKQGALPSWDDLLKPDDHGYRYIESNDPPVDPWGHRYVIRSVGDGTAKRAVVLSFGPDGVDGTADDISSKHRASGK